MESHAFLFLLGRGHMGLQKGSIHEGYFWPYLLLEAPNKTTLTYLDLGKKRAALSPQIGS